LKLESNDFVSNELSEFFSDLIWECKYRTTKVKIAFLFEHKSYLVKHPHFQLLRYMVGKWEAQLKVNDELSVVIPIIIYHGEDSWKVRPLSEYFKDIDENLKAYIPDFQYELTDLSKYSDEQLIQMNIGKLLNIFLAMQHVRDIEYIKKHFDVFLIHLDSYLKTEEGENFFQSLLVYLLKSKDLKREELIQVIEKINQTTIGTGMNVYDYIIEQGVEIGYQKGEEKGIEKGYQKGIEKGYQKGIEKEKIEVILTAYSKGLELDFIAEIVHLPLEEVKAVIARHHN
jgi:predicted transposase/invertase (TIGR01784 family)